MENKKEDQKKLTRRNFLKNSGLTLGGIALGTGLGSAFSGTKEITREVEVEKIVENNANKALMYFTPDQFKVMEAAVERIYPEDSNGPGAKELNATYFIDHQLAGNWGTGAKEYTQGPFFPGEPTQGYQGHLNRQQIFNIGIKGMSDYSLKTFKKPFEELTPKEQDEVLTAFEEGNVELRGVSASYFFALLRQGTIEGVYSDPMYGGNHQMGGWVMKNFPGHQMSYTNIIEDDQFHKIEPQSLTSQHQQNNHNH